MQPEHALSLYMVGNGLFLRTPQSGESRVVARFDNEVHEREVWTGW